MFRTDKINKFVPASIWIQECLIFILCFIYLLLKIYPILILEVHTPVFLTGIDFLLDFLKIPGGPVNWLSSLLMQFWFSDFISSIFLTICFWIVGFLTKKWIETLTENRPIHTIHFIPVCLLLFLYANYDFDLSIILAVIINLFFLVLFIRLSPKQPVIYIGLGLTITTLLYWITGGAFFIFAVLCGLGDILFKRKIVGSLSLLLISAILPFAASRFVFLITLKQAYLHNLTFENQIESWIIAYCFPAYFILVIVIVAVLKKSGNKKTLQKFSRLKFVWKWAIGTLFLLSGTVLVMRESTNDIKKLVLQVNRAVSEERWTTALGLTQHCSNETPLLSSQTNLALFQTGKLLDSMFAYPQSKGTAGLLMNQTWCLSWPKEASNVNWKLGLVNESQHYAHEALERKGPTAYLLKQLGMVYMLKGDHNAAGHFLLNLKKVPFQEKAAQHLIRINENPAELAQDSVCRDIQLRMPNTDLVSDERVYSSKLKLLLKRNPKNKMAFEYLIAYNLLNRNLKEILNHISDFNTFAYSQLPRHVQEALILNAVLTPDFDKNQLKKWIHPNNFKRFVEHRQVLVKYNGDKNSAKYELQRQFGDTYWYYLMFVKPGLLQPITQYEYQ